MKQSRRRVLNNFSVDFRGVTSRTARMRWFDPSNPDVFVPRAIGIGWDINFGALAVKLGLVDPDTSLPQLEKFVPATVSRGLGVAPLAGATVVTAASIVAIATTDELPAGWDKTLHAKDFTPTGRIVWPLQIVSTAVAAWSVWQHRRHKAVDVPATAVAVAIQTASLLKIVGGIRSSRAERRGQPVRCGAPVLAALAVPSIIMGTCVGTVKSAATNLDRIIADRSATTR